MSPETKAYDQKMLKTIEVVKSNFASVRAGRANAGVLDRITVEYYGTPTPLNQVAAISSPDPRTLMIQPWDGSLLKAIEKAIQTSDLGINPQNDGKVIRLAFPQLTEERRKSRCASTARRARWPCETSAGTPWRILRRKRRPPSSPRTTSSSWKRSCRT